MDMHLRRQFEACCLEHRWPEERVKIGDVLADEVTDLNRGIVEASIAVFRPPFARRSDNLPHRACIRQTGDVPHRSIDPDIEIISRCVGNFETEIRRWTTDVPIAQFFIQKCAVQPIRNLWLERPRAIVAVTARPFFQEGAKWFEPDKIMFC